jgi:DNA-binding transcriptional regulator YdaS (Cro superfamily)
MTKSDRLVKVKELADGMGDDTPDQLALMEGLSDQQKLIVRFKLRGLSQKAIAQVLAVTPARVSQEMQEIKRHYIERGSDINQAVIVGESMALFEEVEQKAWEVFHNDETKKLRALDTVMLAREKQLKLLMDLGLLKRAAIEHAHDVVVSPLLKNLSPERREEIVARIIETTPGIEPEPPEDDIEDAEIISYESLPKDSDSN